jgi:uncharacterized protein YxeA
MKKSLKSIITIIIGAILLSSCATHMGTFDSSASLTTANFKYVRVVRGEAQTTKVFQIGGLKTNALVAKARQNMFEYYPLKENQAYVNVSVDFKNSYFLLVNKVKVTITADIVEFSK